MDAAIDLKYWGQTVRDLDDLIGPLRKAPAPFSAFEALEGEYRGRTIRAVWLGRVGSRSPSGSTLHLGASIGERPIRTYVWRRKGSTIFGPTATTGDADFDEMYIASARPPDVVSAAFDDDVRSMIRRRWYDADSSLNVDEGWAKIAAGRSTPGPRGQRPPPTFDQLRSILDDVILVADRLSAAFDDRLAEIEKNEGAAAAAEWVEECRADLVTRRRVGRGIAFLLLVALAAAIAAVAAVFVR